MRARILVTALARVLTVAACGNSGSSKAADDTTPANTGPSKVQSGKFVPVHGERGKPWVCLNTSDPNVDNPQPVSFVTS
jgi:hypothetical protein